VPPQETALRLSGQMRIEQIGALIVSSDGHTTEGIVSERDLAYGLATYGARLPTIAVSQLMTNAVAVCSPDDSITDLIKLMTNRRIRHVPVKDGDQLVGIVSIGDVLKHRLGELQVEAGVRLRCGCSALGLTRVGPSIKMRPLWASRTTSAMGHKLTSVRRLRSALRLIVGRSNRRQLTSA